MYAGHAIIRNALCMAERCCEEFQGYRPSTDAQVGHVTDGFVQTCIETAFNPAVLPPLLRRTPLYKLSLLTHNNNPRLLEEPEANQARAPTQQHPPLFSPPGG